MINDNTKHITFRTLALLVLIVPSLFLAGNLWSKYQKLQQAETINLAIGGYDPIHILHGHFVRFSFDRETIETNPKEYCYKDDCKICFHKNDEGWKATYIDQQTVSATQCTHVTSKKSLLRSGHKYFIPEKYAKTLDKLLRDPERRIRRRNEVLRKKGHALVTLPPPTRTFSMDVAILRNGATAFKMLRINDMPWMEYLKQNPQK